MVIAATSSHPESTTQSKTIGILIAGEFFNLARLTDSSQTEAFQHAMDSARHRYGHALCQCRRPELKLQIRLRDGKYHLAVWPEEGHLHDSDCVFFRDIDHPGIAQPAQVTHGAVDNRSATDAGALKVDFSLTRVRHAPKQAPKQPSELEPPTYQTLRSLLHTLWAEASLTRWHPKWSRDWGRARYELMLAAERLTVNGEPLSRHLFIPRPYREDIKGPLNREMERFVSHLVPTSDGLTRSGLVIAPLRRITSLDATGKMAWHFRHMHKPIGINETTYDFVQRNCKSAIKRAVKNGEKPAHPVVRPNDWVTMRYPEAIAIVHVETTNKGGLWARSAWVMGAHPSVFIPANNADEVSLIDALMNGSYQFNRNLFMEQPSYRTSPDWIVRHVLDPEGHPVPRAALEILPKGSATEYVLARANIADRMARIGVPVWTWTTDGKVVNREVPSLPRHASQNQTIPASAQYRQQLKSAAYAYGSGRTGPYPG